jgi:hypothetical protein
MKMKTRFFTSAILAAAFVLSVSAKDVYDIRPDAKVQGAPTAAEWQDVKENAAALAAATAEDKLAAHVSSAESAEALAGKARGAYYINVIDAHVIAAVTQYVMKDNTPWWMFWASDVSAERARWIAALVKTAMNAKDAYVAQFCIDQLRWCATKDEIPAIKEIAAKFSDKGVSSIAEMAVKELAK